MAVASLCMAFATDDLQEMIEESYTDEYPDGVASEVIKLLEKKYRPTDRVAGVEAETALMKLKMDPKKSQSKYFRKLAVLKFLTHDRVDRRGAAHMAAWLVCARLTRHREL